MQMPSYSSIHVNRLYFSVIDIAGSVSPDRYIGGMQKGGQDKVPSYNKFVPRI